MACYYHSIMLYKALRWDFYLFSIQFPDNGPSTTLQFLSCKINKTISENHFSSAAFTLDLSWYCHIFTHSCVVSILIGIVSGIRELVQDSVEELHNVSVSRIEVMRHGTTVHVDFVFIFTSISLIHHQPHYVFQHDSDKPNPIIILP